MLFGSHMKAVLLAAGPLLEQHAEDRPFGAHSTVLLWLRDEFNKDIAVSSHDDVHTTAAADGSSIERGEALVRAGHLTVLVTLSQAVQCGA